jgi:hypothetical protein
MKTQLLIACALLLGCSEAAPTIDWTANAIEHRADSGKPLHFTCPSGGTIEEVWGTDSYTDDSSICTAAVHAGRITLDDGGEIAIEVREGADYTGSTRNGITTDSYDGGWRHAFVFVP